MRSFRLVLLFALFAWLGLSGLGGWDELENTAAASTPPSIQRGTDNQSVRLETKMDDKRNALEPGSTDLVTAYNQFGFRLFKRLQARREDGNLLVSPTSVAAALAMTFNGTGGVTRQELGRVLGFSSTDLDAVDRANLDLFTRLESADPKVTLRIANSIWAHKGVQFNADFLRRNKEFFRAEVSAVDFADQRTLATINNWVAQKTGNKIEKIVDRLEVQTVMLLINAVYFKGRWQEEFAKSETRPESFHLVGGKEIRTEMMSQSGRYLYQKGDGWQAVSLPYSSTGRFSLYIFLPDEGRDLKGFIGALNQSDWDLWLARFSRRPGQIKLPRFKLESDLDLVEALKELGLASAFDPGRADFSEMSGERGLYIQEVKHKTLMEVNEEGTEAAAATSIGIARSSAMAAPPFNFNANRPFFAAIRDSQTGALLFIGALSDPR